MAIDNWKKLAYIFSESYKQPNYNPGDLVWHALQENPAELAGLTYSLEKQIRKKYENTEPLIVDKNKGVPEERKDELYMGVMNAGELQSILADNALKAKPYTELRTLSESIKRVYDDNDNGAYLTIARIFDSIKIGKHTLKAFGPIGDIITQVIGGIEIPATAVFSYFTEDNFESNRPETFFEILEQYDTTLGNVGKEIFGFSVDLVPGPGDLAAIAMDSVPIHCNMVHKYIRHQGVENYLARR